MTAGVKKKTGFDVLTHHVALSPIFPAHATSNGSGGMSRQERMPAAVLPGVPQSGSVLDPFLFSLM